MWLKRIVFIVAVLALLGGGAAWYAWRQVTGPSVSMDGRDRVLYIPTGATFDMLQDSLAAIGALRDGDLFKLWAEQRSFKKPKPGRYELKPKCSIDDLVLKLRSGDQDPVQVTFNHVRRLPDLAEKLATNLELDEKDLESVLSDPEVMEKYGYNESTYPSLFIPNTYEMWWTATAEEVVERMAKEHDRYWSDVRRAKAASIGLTPVEVSTLASIVQAETNRMEDAPRIAGVYMNRLKLGMALQADPTLKFALGLDSISRVLDKDKLIDSPYNTYLYAGLPPGPISMPDPRFLSAVLEYEQHKYLYFCAKEDLSGASNFARTYTEHLRNARLYQRALDKRGIYR